MLYKPGQLLPAGTPMPLGVCALTHPDGRIEILYAPTEKLKRYHASTTPNLLMEGTRGTGKAVALDTSIPTPDGMRTMRALRVGGRVFDAAGAPTRVVWKSEPHLDPTGTFRVTFSDGEHVVCGGAHEWPTLTHHARETSTRKTPEWRAARRARRTSCSKGIRRQPKYGAKVCAPVPPLTPVAISTRDLARTLTVHHGREHNHALPMPSPWQCASRHLPIDPYTLGVWLGDGTSATGEITSADREVIEQIRAAGYVVEPRTAKDRWVVRGLTTQLRSLGVLGAKHLPESYAWGSPAQRLAMLQGLMDSDGYCSPKTHTVEFCNTNKQLAESVFHLAASLGVKPGWAEGRATLYGKDCGPKYRVCWTHTLPVFRLPRKRANLPARLRTTRQYRYVVAVEQIADEWVQCIEVESPTHLYLVGRAGIPTHNSTAMRWDFHMRALACPGFTYLILRRTMPELKKSHLHFINGEMQKLGGFYHNTDNIAVYPNASRGYFGHCETEADVMKYLSAQFCAIGFDEITTFDWDMVIKIGASARVPADSGMLAIVRAGTNPLGVSAEEVYRYYIAKDITPEEDPEYVRGDWENIHLVMEDNPHLDADQYRKRFAGLPEAYRKAWLDGTWGVEGAYFSIRDTHLLNDMPLVRTEYGVQRALDFPWMNIYRCVDWGWHDQTVCVWVAVLPNGREIPFKEHYWTHTTAKEVAREIKRLSEEMRVVTTFADPTLWDGEKEMSHCLAYEFEGCGVSLTKAKNDRTASGYALQEHLNTTIDTTPKMQFYAPGVPFLISAMRAMKIDKKAPGRIADHKRDHGPIALGYFAMAGVPGTLIPRESTVRPWMRPKSGQHYVLGSANVR